MTTAEKIIIISGDDAKKFMDRMNENNKIDPATYARMMENYNSMRVK